MTNMRYAKTLVKCIFVMLFVIYYFNLKPKTDLIETQKFLNAVVQKPSTHVI